MNFYNKNILLIIHQGNLGGAERQGLGISKILTEKYRCNVDVLLTYSSEMDADFESFAKECHVRNILFFGEPYLYLPKEFSYKNVRRLWWSFKYLITLRNGLISWNYDVLVPFLNAPSRLSYYLYKLLPSAKFTFWHQLGYDVVNNDWFEHFAAYNTPCIIANAENGLEMFRSHYKVKEEKLFVLPQYVSLPYIELNQKSLKEKFNIPADKIVIGMVAHYRPEKLHEFLIAAFEELLVLHDNIHLILLGNKNFSPVTESKFLDLNRYITQKGLNNNISLLSGVKVQEVLNILDIGVLVSEIEGMPNAVMEYMLYSLPVISTNHPGCKRLLADSEFLIENEKRELINKLTQLIIDGDERILEGRKNKKKLKDFDMENYIIQLDNIISTVLDTE